MDSYWMLLFTQVSLTMLAIGALVISGIARTIGGSRLWAIIMSLTSLGVSLAMFFTYDPSGILPALVGLLALILAVTPKSKR